MKFRTTILFGNVVNTNDRMYTEECMKAIFKQLQNPVWGRIGYTDETALDVNDVAFQAEKPRLEGRYANELTVEIKVLDLPKGRELRDLLKDVVFRTSGSGNLNSVGSHYEVTDYKLNYIAAVPKSADSFTTSKSFVWNNVRDFAKSKKNGEMFTRTDLKNALGIPLRSRGNGEHEVTMDNYRNWLTKAGYLQKGNKRGTYIKKKDIPADLSSSAAFKQAYKR